VTDTSEHDSDNIVKIVGDVTEGHFILCNSIFWKIYPRRLEAPPGLAPWGSCLTSPHSSDVTDTAVKCFAKSRTSPLLWWRGGITASVDPATQTPADPGAQKLCLEICFRRETVVRFKVKPSYHRQSLLCQGHAAL